MPKQIARYLFRKAAPPCPAKRFMARVHVNCTSPLIRILFFNCVLLFMLMPSKKVTPRPCPSTTWLTCLIPSSTLSRCMACSPSTHPDSRTIFTLVALLSFKMATSPGSCHINLANMLWATFSSRPRAPHPSPCPDILSFVDCRIRRCTRPSSGYILKPGISKNWFLFSIHADRVASDGIVLLGISNAYICRFQCSDSVTGELLTIEADQFCSFPSDSEDFKLFDTCYPYQVWTSGVQIQDTFRRMLSSRSEK
jgi:hypothetical protein